MKVSQSWELPVKVYFTDKTTESLFRITERSARNGSWDNAMQYTLLLASLQHCLLQRSLQLSSVLCTLTEIALLLFVPLCHTELFPEVTIPSEVRVNFSNDFSEANTLLQDPAKKSYSFHSVIEVPSSGFGDSLKTVVPVILGYFLLQPLDHIYPTRH